MPRLLLPVVLACVLATPGCLGAPLGGGKKPAGVQKSAAPVAPVVANGVAVPAGPVVTLTGKVKIISDNGGGIISDNGAGLIAAAKGEIISDNGGGVISNNSGSIISNNSGAIISDNGAGLTGKVKRQVLVAPTHPGLRDTSGSVPPAAKGLAVFRLADATITLEDAAGHVLTDKAGHPITAVSDKDGSYKLSSPLPPGNLVAKIKLWNGGTLQAMVARDGAGELNLDLDTASTMGAAYVLGQFVKGSQPVFDKLPRAEAERLTGQLDVVRGYLTGAFKYDARLLTEATDALRKREQGVDQEIETVKALLLGQSAIGNALQATSVPLGEPVGLLVKPDGTLVIGERFAGRVRLVGPDGVLKTLVDSVFGEIQQNFFGQPDLALGPDGTIYAASQRLARVFKLDAKTATPIMGTGQEGRGTVGAPLETPIFACSLAVGPDGTVYMAEHHGTKGADGTAPRILALDPAGTLRDLGIKDWPVGDLLGLTVEPDGALVVLHNRPHAGSGRLYRVTNGVAQAFGPQLVTDIDSDVARLPDGHLLVSEPNEGRVTRLDADGGNPMPFLGVGGLAASKELVAPNSLGTDARGTVYVADGATNLVYRLGTDGSWTVVAGTLAASQSGDTTAFAINQPMGLAEDAQGGLLIAEGGSSAIKRYADGRLELVCGGRRGSGGDGGPAASARLDAPTGLAFGDGTTWIQDTGNRSVRKIGPDGTIATAAGVMSGMPVPAPGTRQPAAQTQISGMLLMALAPDGRPYWTSQADHTIVRLAGDQVEGVVGKPSQGNRPGDLISGVFGQGTEADPAKLNISLPFGLAFDRAGDLYFTDLTGFRIYKLVGPAGPSPRVEVYAGLGAAQTLALGQALGPDSKVDPGKTRDQVAIVVPTGLCFDPAGNMYVAEAGTRNFSKLGSLFGDALPLDPTVFPPIDARIRKIAPDGTVTIIAGPGGKYFARPTAVDALVFPTSLLVDHAGRLVIVDSGANLVRILPAGTF